MSIGSFERYPLLFGPSPVHPLERLSAHLGGTPVWAKREDCNSGIAYGGNKTRKLEYLVADALAREAKNRRLASGQPRGLAVELQPYRRSTTDLEVFAELMADVDLLLSALPPAGSPSPARPSIDTSAVRAAESA